MCADVKCDGAIEVKNETNNGEVVSFRFSVLKKTAERILCVEPGGGPASLCVFWDAAAAFIPVCFCPVQQRLCNQANRFL